MTMELIDRYRHQTATAAGAAPALTSGWAHRQLSAHSGSTGHSIERYHCGQCRLPTPPRKHQMR